MGHGPTTVPARTRPTLTKGHLEWRLAGYRRAAIRNIERTLTALTTLRRVYNDAGLDDLLAEFRAVLGLVRSLDPARPPPAPDLKTLEERLAGMQRSLGRPGAAAEHRPEPAPIPGDAPSPGER
jgi:hypothetical protein